jgi:hypothetical protein
MKVIDPGHLYVLKSLDDEKHGYSYLTSGQTLRFVKRCHPPEKFSGNVGSYPGTTVQEVLRALTNRVRYLQGQVWCVENVVILFALRFAIWLLEFRAARRHRIFYRGSLDHAEFASLCPECGHVTCYCNTCVGRI